MMQNRRGSRAAAWLVPIVVLGLLGTTQAFAAPAAKSPTRGFVSFRSFTEDVSSSTYASAKRHGEVAATPAAYAQMRTYVQQLYAGVDVRRSFVANGSYFDCVTIMSQPSVRALGITHIAAAPSAATGKASRTWTTEGPDAHGHVVSCAAGTIPMQRVTLGQMAQYPSVRAFLTRGHDNPNVDTSAYRYAHAFQSVNNLGATSVINVWNPKVPTGTGEDHSLSQQWMSGGSGAKLQTAEAGWTKDLGFSTKDPVFFTYFTADDYNKTGCYDLECTAFVQVNNSVALGGVVSPCCSTPTVDDRFTQEYHLTAGKWWLNVNGTDIGYFPTKLYKKGQMSKNATEVDFGGEVYGGVTTANWPQMGSGKPASAGFMKAAYQSQIQYIGLNAALNNAALTPSATSPCYTISYAAASGGTGTYFYFGGKGGKQGVC